MRIEVKMNSEQEFAVTIEERGTAIVEPRVSRGK